MDIFKTVLSFVYTMRPADMTLLMFVLCVFDLWAALRLSAKNKSGFLSKALIQGYAYDLLMITIPIALSSPMISGESNHMIIFVISLATMVLYSIGTISSILANYAALYPSDSNAFIRYIYRILEREIRTKLEKQDAIK